MLLPDPDVAPGFATAAVFAASVNFLITSSVLFVAASLIVSRALLLTSTFLPVSVITPFLSVVKTLPSVVITVFVPSAFSIVLPPPGTNPLPHVAST